MIQLTETLRITFGSGGNSAAFIGNGWGDSESAAQWMLDTESQLSIARPGGTGDAFLAIDLAPFVVDPMVPGQRLALYINNVPQPGQYLRDPSVLIYKIDAALLASSETVLITFYHPDAAQPSALQIWHDDRHLAFFVSEILLLRSDNSSEVPPLSHIPKPASAVSRSALDTISEAQMLRQFASVGDNCELGLFQRRYGAEPVDIFRFSGISLPSLILGLEERFEALCDLEQIFFEIKGPQGHREYILHHRRYELQSHTLILEGTLSLDRLIERQIKSLFFGRRLLMDDLASGQRIFVVKRNDPIPLMEARRLSALLRQFGPNTLLVVARAADGTEPGQVDDLGDGLLWGHIDGLLDYDHADGIASDCWMTICSNASALWCHAAVPPEGDNRPVINPKYGPLIVEDIYRVLSNVITQELGVATTSLSPETELDDLSGWDSVTIASVLLELEGIFGVTFDRSELDNIRTAADLVGLIRARIITSTIPETSMIPGPSDKPHSRQ